MNAAFAELGSVAEFVNGAAFKPEDWCDRGQRIIRIQNLTDASKDFNRTTRNVPPKLHVQPGDLLVSWSASLGVFEWAGPDVALLNQHIFRVLPDEKKVDKRYLRHGLERALQEMRRHLHGATMQHVNRGEFLSTKIYLPSLPEQRRIAEILDKADALRAKRRAALAQLDTLTQSIFLDMFGDPATNPKGWPRREIGELLESASYGTSKKSGSVGEFPVLRMNNISRLGAMDLTELKFMDLEDRQRDRYLVRSGDVLFNRTNSADLVGKTGIVRERRPMAYAGYLIRLRANNEMDPEFLWAYLNSDYSKRMLRGMCKSIIGMANINATEIQAMKIPHPPQRMQHEFARRVSKVEMLKSAYRPTFAELDGLMASLQHRAFRGEL
jgi:type I restriction enzyme S subunit